MLSVVISALLLFIGYFLHINYGQFTRLFFMFFSGAVIYMFRAQFRVSAGVSSALCVLLLIAGILSKSVFFVVYYVSVAYIVVCLAYLPKRVVRKYNCLGDYSYGIYIYAFPVQQCISALVPEVSVSEMMFISLVVTTFLAVVSWYCVEKPFICLKSNLKSND